MTRSYLLVILDPLYSVQLTIGQDIRFVQRETLIFCNQVYTDALTLSQLATNFIRIDRHS